MTADDVDALPPQHPVKRAARLMLSYRERERGPCGYNAWRDRDADTPDDILMRHFGDTRLPWSDAWDPHPYWRTAKACMAWVDEQTGTTRGTAHTTAAADRADIPREKRCSRCKRHKPAKRFSRNRAKPDGLCSWCKGCRSEYEKQRSVA